ncbi:lycopene cyclase family protein [Hanstruepera marina]|uniref:lycopene cyclase family protein n=1 Tax=Hanstruepera marina TaxID=2873265 RepID=UPI001CA672FF|nr:lycopene cyclase family protein [Hanstruepera marina]
MPKPLHFDYIIIGSGLAGLQLALGLSRDHFFKNKQIALIDPKNKTENDKTWSFWEQGSSKWDKITHKTWSTALFCSNKINLKLDLKDYTYKTIRSIDFYTLAINELKEQDNIHFVLDTINRLEEREHVNVYGEKHNYIGQHVFDSRIPEAFFSDTKHTIIHQHFKGFVIKSKTPCFNPGNFTIMDFRFQYKLTTSFIYVLPFSESEALIEYTFFTPHPVDEQVYDEGIDSYLKHELNLDQYTITETERGNIPMTDFEFWNYNSKHITKIGTGGGWVKGSTGYSFKHTEKNVATIIMNLKSYKNPTDNLIKKKYRFYDKIFLNVLYENNDKGVWIFEQFYKKNSVNTMFQFLDEETTFFQDIKIMQSLFSITFIKAFFRVLFRY